jgi:hypothetical protein
VENVWSYTFLFLYVLMLWYLLCADTAYGFEVLDIAVGGLIHERTADLTSVKRGKKTTNIFTHINFMHFSLSSNV